MKPTCANSLHLLHVVSSSNGKHYRYYNGTSCLLRQHRRVGLENERSSSEMSVVFTISIGVILRILHSECECES